MLHLLFSLTSETQPNFFDILIFIHLFLFKIQEKALKNLKIKIERLAVATINVFLKNLSNF